MNKRQQKKNSTGAGALELEKLTARVVDHITELNRLINQQRVMLEIQNINLKTFSLWQHWGATLPTKEGYYVVFSNNATFGLLYFNEGIYMDQNRKRIDAKKLETIVAWLPLPSIPAYFMKEKNCQKIKNND